MWDSSAPVPVHACVYSAGIVCATALVVMMLVDLDHMFNINIFCIEQAYHHQCVGLRRERKGAWGRWICSSHICCIDALDKRITKDPVRTPIWPLCQVKYLVELQMCTLRVYIVHPLRFYRLGVDAQHVKWPPPKRWHWKRTPENRNQA